MWPSMMRRALAAILLLCFLQQSLGQGSVVTLGDLTPWGIADTPPMTNWLLTPATTAPTGIPDDQRLAWRKLGSKVWTMLTTMDHDFVSSTGSIVPASLRPNTRRFPAQCGRLARQFIRMVFHDCGTFDVGNTGSYEGTANPRFGCNASIRKELVACNPTSPTCWQGVERRFDLTTGVYLNENVWAPLVAKYGSNVVAKQYLDPAIDTVNPRFENAGFGMPLAILYQFRLETLVDETGSTQLSAEQLTMTDLMVYAGLLSIVKCGGPQIEFQPGRPDATVADAPGRLPNAIEPLTHTISYFWTNGVTVFDAVNLLAAHSTACFSAGCLDATPAIKDNDWARQVQSINTGTDPKICQFDALGNPPVDATGQPISRALCVLPADAELNARSDTKTILGALTAATTTSSVISNAVTINSFFTGTVCRARTGCNARPAPTATPFTLLTTGDNSVNLCTRTSVTYVKQNCPTRATTLTNFHNAVATSWFKMSKWYVRDGVNKGAAWGVVPQPCQPGLVQIGGPEGPLVNGAPPPEPVNPVCNCCPTQPAQTFSYVPPPPPDGVAAASVRVVEETGPAVATVVNQEPLAATVPVEVAAAASVVAASTESTTVPETATYVEPQTASQRAWAALADL